MAEKSEWSDEEYNDYLAEYRRLKTEHTQESKERLRAVEYILDKITTSRVAKNKEEKERQEALRAEEEAALATKARNEAAADEAQGYANTMIAQERYDKSFRGRAKKFLSSAGSRARSAATSAPVRNAASSVASRGRAAVAATAGLAVGAVGAARSMSGGSLFIFFAILLNLFDNKLFRFSFLGSVWNGFQLSSFANVDYLGLLTAPLVMGIILFYYFTKRGGRSLFVSFFVIFLLTFIGKYIQIPLLSSVGFNSLYVYIGLAVVIVIGALFKVIHDKKILETDEITIIILAYVIGFFFLNPGWMVYWRAQFHFWFIIFFGLMYIRQNEEANGESWKWHMWIIGLLLADFFLTAYIESLPFFQYIPFLTAMVCIYVRWWAEPENKFALWILLTALILLIANQASASGYLGSYDFLQAGKVVDDSKSVFARSYETIKLAIERQIEFATGGLYRSQVELNQYAPLGVFFERVRAAQPRFYDDEPVTLWATISARTLGDPIVVNFDCSRWNGNTRVNLQSDDKLTPPYPFTVGTYEEKDVECTFSEKKLAAGLNTISLSATYNFDTSAYQKLYFMDKERLRAMRRENLDPLKEYGITDLSIDATEDQGPATIYTNGPVELAVRAGNKLIAVSNDKDIYPVLEILLQNRNKITDKNGKPVGEWQGKIKKVNELVVVLPAGMKLLTTDCNPVSFKEIDVNKYCVDSCTEVCKNSCEEYNYDLDKKKQCIDSCPDPAKSDTRKKCDSQCLGLFRGDTTKEKYHGYALDIEKLNELDANSGYRDIDRFKTFQCRITADRSVLDNVPITTKYIRLKARYDYLLEKSYDVTVEKSPVPTVPVSSQKAIDNAVGKIQEGYVQLGDISIPYNSLNALVYLESRGRHCCMESGKNGATTCKPSDDLSCSADKVLTSFDGSSVGIMQVNTICSGCAERNRNFESRVCDSGQNIYTRSCNIKVGLEILKDSYRNYKDGIKEDTLNKYCSSKWIYPENGGRNLHNLYLSYKNFDAVLRAYNGWGCNLDKLRAKCASYCGTRQTCTDNCISGTVFYVDKVNEIARQMQSGQIQAPLAIDELPTMAEFEDSATPTK